MENAFKTVEGSGVVIDFKRKTSYKNMYRDLWYWLHPKVLEYRMNKHWYGEICDDGKIRDFIRKFRLCDIEGEQFACIYKSDNIEADIQFVLFMNIKDIEMDRIPVYGGLYDSKYKEICKIDNLKYFEGDPFYIVYYAEGIISSLNQLLRSG